MAEVVFAGDPGAAESLRDGREHLDIEQLKIAGAEVLHERAQGHFGGVAGAVEHGFASEESAHGDAINATGEFVVEPAFEAVRVALFVQAGVGLDEFGSDPCATPAGPRQRAPFHHLAEGLVGGDAKFTAMNDARQASRDVQAVKGQHPARIG